MLPIGPQEKWFALKATRKALQEYLGRGVVSEYHTSSPQSRNGDAARG